MKLINYPAMASPASIEFIDWHVARHLEPGSNIIDPFCGTGRLLFSPRRQGHHVTGVDCSPVAILAARVLHQKCSIERIAADIEKLKLSLDKEGEEFLAEEGELFWFAKPVYSQLRRILKDIDILSSSANTRRFFWLSLVRTARIASYIRENEYKSHRMGPDKRIDYKPDSNSIFIDSCYYLLKRLGSAAVKEAGNYTLALGDIEHMNLPRRKFNAVITSPPYGDSRSTVGYGQYAHTPLMILSCSNSFAKEFNLTDSPRSIDTYCLGGTNCKTTKLAELPTTVHYLDKGPMKKFCIDYFQRLESVSDVLTEKSLFCLVLADRTYKKQKFPLIESTTEFLAKLGFAVIDRHDRYLSWKRLPRTMRHICDAKSATHTGMNYETVLVCGR